MDELPDGGTHADSGVTAPQCPGHGGQTCETEASSHCLTCAPSSACVAPTCDGLRDTRWHLEQVSCESEPFMLGDVLHQVADAGCGAPLYFERDGGSTLYGHLYLHENYELSARIDALGGTCLVSGLPTGVERVLFECPRCQFVLANRGP